ncbi:MAG: tRNA guanosine(34) transglycosylase Tgt [Deltaproteobacteria bacterium]|nr:tRNA guanosine(34) transglycosylase Tgt [Deltaproteobacteria bacterium]
MNVRFTRVAQTPGGARAGILHTRRGDVPTPVFMPVATHAAFRHVSLADAAAAGAPVILSNTYHLLDAPGPEVLSRAGGIHRFTGWPGVVLTDSGGFQLFSLRDTAHTTERAAHFRLPTGRRVTLSPEASMAMQHAIGSDIMMVMDVCVESTLPLDPTREAMLRTHRWARRSVEAHHRAGTGQALFGIVQGGVHESLRRESAAELAELPFDGMAIGGLAVGEGRAEREAMTALVAPMLPADKPRYLMGVGTPLDIVEAVHRGMDMFDCILPTKMAQQSYAYTFRGTLELRRPSMRFHDGPLEPGCDCAACTTHGLAYVHHLLRGGHAQGVRLVAIHNIRHLVRLVTRLRDAILRADWDATIAPLRAELPRRLKEPLT